MSLHYVPNLLSILRIILTIPIVISLLRAQYLLTLSLFFIASTTDALDGFIAKRFSHQTWLGTVLDPLADKILLTALFITLYYLSLVPIWLLVIVLFRDVVLIAGVVGYYYDNKNTRITPSNISKLNTVLQILAILAVVVAQLQPLLVAWLDVFYIIVATSTILSGVDYAWAWIKHIINKQQDPCNN